MQTRQIPEGAETREFADAAVVAYCFVQGDRPALKAYKGRQTKPAIYYTFKTAEARDRYLTEFVAREAEKQAFKRERQQARHGLVAGDILSEVWGYEQTNVTFYEVVRVPSERSATVRQIQAHRIEGEGMMSGSTTPKPGVFEANAEPVTRRATGLHELGGGRNGGSLSKWDGKPKRFTSYH
ncbi:hypothetical protein [Xanthomonas hortorum]|uniref:hypothetical protein n=1 Tax=Xanthomonas hortorum TaxID=56454 RepID=UPI0032E8B936